MVWLSAQTLCPRQTSQNVEERQRKAQGLKGFNPVNGSEEKTGSEKSAESVRPDDRKGENW